MLFAVIDINFWRITENISAILVKITEKLARFCIQDLKLFLQRKKLAEINFETIVNFSPNLVI